MLLRLSWPLILGQIAVVGMNVTDIYMAGQVGPDTLAAVQLGSSIWAVISLVVIGIMIGNSPIIGNYWAGNRYGALPVPAGTLAGTAHGVTGGAGYSLRYLYFGPAGYVCRGVHYWPKLPAALPDHCIAVPGIFLFAALRAWGIPAR